MEVSAEITITMYRDDLIPLVEARLEFLKERYRQQVLLFHREVCDRYRVYTHGWLLRRRTRSDAELVEMTKSLLDSGVHCDSPVWDAFADVRKVERDLRCAQRVHSSLLVSVEAKVTMSRQTAVNLGAAEAIKGPQPVDEILSA